MRSASGAREAGPPQVTATDALTGGQVASLRRLFVAAWPGESEGFTREDWDHAFGGIHFVVEVDGEIVSHASVVPRELHAGDHRLVTGYVEAVATSPEHRRRGFASAVMLAVGEHVDRSFELGALGTGAIDFYRRLGWVVWRGPTFVRTDAGLVATPEENGYILVRLTPATPPLDIAAPISCDWRPGDAW